MRLLELETKFIKEIKSSKEVIGPSFPIWNEKTKKWNDWKMSDVLETWEYCLNEIKSSMSNK